MHTPTGTLGELIAMLFSIEMLDRGDGMIHKQWTPYQDQQNLQPRKLILNNYYIIMVCTNKYLQFIIMWHGYGLWLSYIIESRA